MKGPAATVYKRAVNHWRAGLRSALPMWHDAYMQVPALPLSNGPVQLPKPIVYLEDLLRERFHAEHPEEKPDLRVHKFNTPFSRPNFTESVIKLQVKLMKEGKSEDEAYRIASREYHKMKAATVTEDRVLEERALYFGGTRVDLDKLKEARANRSVIVKVESKEKKEKKA